MLSIYFYKGIVTSAAPGCTARGGPRAPQPPGDREHAACAAQPPGGRICQGKRGPGGSVPMFTLGNIFPYFTVYGIV